MAKKFSPAKKISDTTLDKGVKNLMYGNKIFSGMYHSAYLELKMVEINMLGKDSAEIVQSNRIILLNKDFKLNPSEWEYVIAHCILHLAFGHFDANKISSPCTKKIWNMACDIYIAKFLSDVKIGTPSNLRYSYNIFWG